MANIDVTDLLSDPDFSDCFTVLRRAAGVDANGRATYTPTSFPALVGVVQPARGQTLRQRPDLANVDGAIEIWAQFQFKTQSAAYAADQITWRGNTYEVAGPLDDFQNYGQGYTHIVATLQTPVPLP